MMVRVAVISNGLFRHTGGPSVVIPKLVEALSLEGTLEINLFLPNGDLHSSVQALGDNCKVHPVNVYSPWRFSIKFLGKILNSKPDIIWIHGFWLFPSFSGILVSWFLRVPVIYTPHGVFTASMFKRHIVKKLILGLPELMLMLLRKDKLFHFLSDSEKDNSAVIVNSESRVVPNFIGDSLRFNLDEERKGIVFMARIHPIKGIEDVLLLEHDIDIYGFGEERYIDRIALKRHRNFHGEIEHDDVIKTLVRYEWYVLPSYGEGLPTSALEAARAGCLLIVSEECNLNMFNEFAITFRAGPDQLRLAIEKAINMDSEEKALRREGIRRIYNEHFSDRVIKNSYIELLNDIIRKR